jgi:PPOX class probable F420-dependent enzyme
MTDFAGKYISVETYRRNGQAVPTPVWFAEAGGRLYVYSLANAGKVKRIRHTPRVRVAPCDMRGNVTGEWVAGEARILGAAEASRAQTLLRQKYGVLKAIGDWYSKLTGRLRTYIEIRVQ